jgi:hypothetical protein
MLSGNILPIHFKPLDDELLSSWLMRLIRANFMSYRTFYAQVMPNNTDRNRDLDRSADIELLKHFEVKTGAGVERSYRTALRAYEGFIYEKHNTQGNTNWIMPIGIHGGAKMRYGLQCCPQCLSEGEPYFRRSWRLAFVTCCVQHGNMLVDRCPECGDTISFIKTPIEKDSITFCKICGYDLRSFRPGAASNRLLNIQRRLLDTVDSGWIILAGDRPIYSHLYFLVLHQVVRLLCIGRRARRFREVVQEELGLIGLESIFTEANSHIEHLCVADRAILTEAAVWLLEEWPDRFVHVCKESGVGKAEITCNMPTEPFWFTQAVDQVDKTPFMVSDEEMTSAVSLLKAQGKRVNNVALNRLMGRGETTRKRSGVMGKW